MRSVPGANDWRHRFPGFDSASLSAAWDPVTAGVVLARIGPNPSASFFTADEEAIATALFDQLLQRLLVHRSCLSSP